VREDGDARQTLNQIHKNLNLARKRRVPGGNWVGGGVKIEGGRGGEE